MLSGRRDYCNNGRGPYDTPIASICYCICQSPMHYASYYAALDEKFGDQDPLPESPFIVDLGCGPGTTLFALADWMRKRRKRSSRISYLGIDISRPLRDIASEMIRGEGLFDRSCIIIRETIEQVADADLAKLVHGRDGVIFALSYVVHQEFMHDMTLLASLMKRVSTHTNGLDTWFLLQDANFPDRPDEKTEIWPENRLNVLANRCDRLGYRLRPQKVRFAAPRVTITEDGRFRTEEAGPTDNVCRFFHKIA